MPRPRIVPELLVSDLPASLHFYVGLIGFAVLYERPEEKFAYLDGDGAELMLQEASTERDDPRVWWTAKPEKPYGRGMHLQIEVADVDEIHARLRSSDWPLFRPMEERWYRRDKEELGNQQFLVQDPDGYLLRFFTGLGRRAA